MTELFMLVLLLYLLKSSTLLLKNHPPAKTAFWLWVFALLPVIGYFIYLIFGRDIRPRHSLTPEAAAASADHLPPAMQRLTRLLSQNAGSTLTTDNRVEVLTNGENKFKHLCAALEAAVHHIHLEYYILKNDQIGQDILAILQRKSRSGVRVRVILDGLGSRCINQKLLADMKQSGIDVRRFYPMTAPFLFRLNFRNHRKIVVVDGRIGFIGGMNIGDEYLSRNRKLGYFRDTHLKLEGESVHDLQRAFLDDWHLLTGEQLTGPELFPDVTGSGSHPVQIVGSGPDSHWESILQLFFLAVASARKSIYIETPYFIPSPCTLMALKTAALSGVDVRLVIQGLTKQPLTYWAANSFFQELLEAGVQVYVYDKGTLHSKVLLVDGTFGTVGSANFDIRSFLLNFETNAVVYDPQVVARLEEDFRQDLLDSRAVELEAHTQRPLTHRLKESAARLFTPLL